MRPIREWTGDHGSCSAPVGTAQTDRVRALPAGDDAAPIDAALPVDGRRRGRSAVMDRAGVAPGLRGWAVFHVKRRQEQGSMFHVKQAALRLAPDG